MTDGKIVSVWSVAPQPSFDPSKPSELPDVSDKGITKSVTSPSLGACAATINYVLNSTQIGVSITGIDTLPASDCATFTDDVAKNGFEAKLSNVPYPNSSTKATVTIKLAP